MSRQDEIDKIVELLKRVGVFIDVKVFGEYLVDNGIRSKDGFEIKEESFVLNYPSRGSSTHNIIKPIDYNKEL